MMEIIDHGDWVLYKPENYPIRNLPATVLFAQRVSDGMDWYMFQRKELTGEDTIKLTAMLTGNDWVVQSTATDASMLWPINMRLFELVGVTEHHETFRQKVLDLKKRGGDAFGQRRPDPVMTYQFLIALHEAGLLEKFREFLQRAEVPTRLGLEAERLLEFDDRHLVKAARELGWNEGKLRQLFETARDS